MLIFRLNASRKPGAQPKVATAQIVSKRKFDFTTEDRIEKLKQIKLKKSCESKVDWAVTAYIDWRNERLETYRYDPAIYFADITNLDTLEMVNFNHALCRFVPEVKRKRGEGLFPGATLYQLIVALQKFLTINKIRWKLMELPEFEDMRTVLDNVMQERTAANIGVVKRQAGIISYEYEDALWTKGVLGEDKPDKLRHTVLFLLGINVYMRAVEDHYHLRRDSPNEKGQLTFMCNPRGVRCVVYREDSVTKTHDGGLKDMRHERKTVWIYPNAGNVARCPVRLIDKYLSLCPKITRRSNFYLQSLQKPTPSQWYSVQVVGQNTIGKVVKKLMEQAGIEGFFTNHSTRRTGGTRLFRAGVQHKLVKEATGHSSDAIDKYQITSDEQREMMSKVIAGQHVDQVSEVCAPKSVDKVVKSGENDALVTVSESAPTENCNKVTLKETNVGDLINSIIESQKSGGKKTIKINIEITTE